MGGEYIHICQICQSEFENEENLSLHTCVEIKEELQDPKILVGYDDICHDYALNLSEEFLSGILKQVNELCDAVRNGDPDLKRTSQVNENLNNAVSCYRNKLDLIDSKFDKDQIVTETNNSKEHFLEGFLPHSENETAEFDYNPKVDKGKKKKKLSNKNNIKRQLKEGKSNDIKIKPELKGELLKGKSAKQFNRAELFSCLKFDRIKNEFQCTICNKTTSGKTIKTGRKNLLRHIKLMHNNELLNPIKETKDCENSMCKTKYGLYKELWCGNCIMISKLKKPKKKYENILKVRICPECGKSVPNLSSHMTAVHSNEDVPCPHCDRVCKSKMYLNQHIKKVHEKVPCAHCGQLLSSNYMTRHIQAQHTADNEKNHRCDVCSKGFSSKTVLKDHMNIHTGEKPYKCKFCSSCFASRGNHAMHERGHLGNGRKSK